MKYLGIAILTVFIVASASLAEINAKVGLAGGSARIDVEVAKVLKADISGSVDLGYGYNSEYGLISVGASIFKPFPMLVAGIGLTYSAYSTDVQNVLGPGNVTKSGVGFRIFGKKEIRNNVYAEVGYDTRMGAMAEVGMTVRK